MEPVETILVDARTVACDGDAEPSGHPRVFLNIGDADHVDCPYCGRHYVLDPDAAAGARS
ncbi:MAG: zinc-finger domain-containing protein [Alphaproteobacteria bacterium]